MSRDLKQEYEEMLDQEIPDLWSRIEPRLAQKGAFSEAHSKNSPEADSFEGKYDQGFENSAQSVRKEFLQENGGTDAGRQDVQPVEKRIRTRRLKRSTIAVWGSLAAACVCLAVVFPAWRGGKKSYDGTTNQGASSGSAADTTTNNNMDIETPQTENGMSNGMMPDDGYGASADDVGAAGMGGAAEPESAPTAEDASVWMNEAESDYAVDFEGAAIQDKYVDEDGMLQQYECYGEIVDARQTGEGHFYRMKLIEDAAEFLPEGTEILIWQKEGFLSGLFGAGEERLTTGNRYTVVVEPEIMDGETRYVLVSYEADVSGGY